MTDTPTAADLLARIAVLEADAHAARQAASVNFARDEAAQADAEQWARRCAVADDRIAVLEAANRELVMQQLAADGQAQEAYAAQQKAEAALERDRTKVAETINAVRSEISGREWLLTGRGPYEWDDDRYRDEFAQALAAIRSPIDSLRSIARDWSNCPTDPEEIKAARAIIQSRLPALRGVTLCCACHPQYPCHGDVLRELAMIGVEA